MRAHGFNVGGEQSGHIILSDFSTTGDGLVAALQVLACIKRSNKPVSEICRQFEPVPQLLKNVRYKGGKPLENTLVKAAIEEGEAASARRPPGDPALRHRAADPRHGRGRRQKLVETVVNDIVGVIADIKDRRLKRPVYIAEGARHFRRAFFIYGYGRASYSPSWLSKQG